MTRAAPHLCDACGELAPYLYELPNDVDERWLVCASCVAADEAGEPETAEPVPARLQDACGTVVSLTGRLGPDAGRGRAGAAHGQRATEGRGELPPYRTGGPRAVAAPSAATGDEPERSMVSRGAMVWGGARRKT